MDLRIIVLTDISPGKVNLDELESSIEYLIETRFEAVCKKVEFKEVDETE